MRPDAKKGPGPTKPVGAKLGFSFTSGMHFDFLSFDAAGYYVTLPGANLEVIGYKDMGLMVTNSFTVDSLSSRRAGQLPDFETFHRL